MTTALDDIAAQVQARVSYLRCSTAAPRADGWFGCADLIADPVRLRAEIDATASGRGTDDPQVAASLYAQAYAFRVPSIAVAALALGLPVPSTLPTDNAVRVNRHRPAEVSITNPRCRPVGVAEFATEMMELHLAPFVAAIRAGTRIGERLLWGNVAASLATIFRAVDAGPPGDPSVRQRAIELERATGPWLEGLGCYSTVTGSHGVGWYWTRTSCCLWYQTSSGFYCDDCSLHSPEELNAKRVAELNRSDA